MNDIKNIIKELFIFLHFDLTRNIRYDRLTRKILKKVLKNNCNCIDIGCHKGEILDMILKYSPDGKHFAFEPIPHLYKGLELKYKNRSRIFPYALSNRNGVDTFQFVKNAPAYSGLKKRQYNTDRPEIEEIDVELKTLDGIFSEDEKIHFIKIDVEGGEFDVLKGGINLLRKNKPVILFECGKGASDFYGTDPGDLFDFITTNLGLKIYTLQAFIGHDNSMSYTDFTIAFDTCREYYFVAAQ